MAEGIAAGAGVPAAEVMAFFEQDFAADESYDIMPMVRGTSVCATELGTESNAFLRGWLGQQAEADVGGVYQSLLDVVSPRAIAARLPGLLSAFASFGTSEVEGFAKHRIWGAHQKIPLPVARWYAAATEAYVLAVLGQLGYGDAKAEIGSFASDGTEHGVQAVRVPFSFTFA